MNNCPYFASCGACNYEINNYSEEILKKKKYIQNLFAKVGYKKLLNYNEMINPINYRNKAIVAFKLSKSKRIVSGIYEENSHKIVVVKNCLIQNEEINQCLLDLEDVLNKNKILPFGYGGTLKHAVIRYGINTKELLVTLVTETEMFPGRNNVVKDLVNKNNHIKSIVQNIQPRNTPIVLGEKERLLYGPGFIYDTLCGLKFKISSKSFYQINPIQTQVLYDIAIKQANFNKNDVVIDAYSGIGTIGLIASKNVKQVIEVELNKQANLDAIQNGKLNNIKNVLYYAEDSTKFLENLAETNTKIECLIMDPPREGSTYKFIQAISKMKIKKVVYVSCGPESLIRDIETFKEFNYQLENVECVDMFPHTEHVETVCCLVKTDKVVRK